MIWCEINSRSRWKWIRVNAHSRARVSQASGDKKKTKNGDRHPACYCHHMRVCGCMCMWVYGCMRVCILCIVHPAVELSFPSENDLSAYNTFLLVRVLRVYNTALPAAAEDRRLPRERNS